MGHSQIHQCDAAPSSGIKLGSNPAAVSRDRSGEAAVSREQSTPSTSQQGWEAGTHQGKVLALQASP